jgi:large subunit ribosomal protein L4
MKATVYNQKGTKAGEVNLPEAVFGARWNPDLVHQVVTSMQANERMGTAHTKDRSEVAGGGRKPWKQKGTGRARHGSTRSPIWRHGGVTHGPRNEKDYSQKINTKMKAAALYSVLSEKLRQNEVIFVDSLGFEAPKAKEAKAVLGSLGTIEGCATLSTKRKNAALIAVFDLHEAVSKSFANMGNVKVEAVRNLNARDAMDYKYVVIAAPQESIAFLEAKMK